MNEQTRKELETTLAELEIKSQAAWEEYQSAEKQLNDEAEKIGVIADPLENLRAIKKDKQTQWYKLYTALDGIKALLALEGK